MKISDHKMIRSFSGRAETQKITPECSCGWKGTGVPAYNDCQHYYVEQQFKDHMTQIRKGKQDG